MIVVSETFVVKLTLVGVNKKLFVLHVYREMANDGDLYTCFPKSMKRVKFSIENNTTQPVEYYDRACREKITPLCGDDPDDFEIILKMLMVRKNKKSSGGGIRKKTSRPYVPAISSSIQKRIAAQKFAEHMEKHTERNRAVI